MRQSKHDRLNRSAELTSVATLAGWGARPSVQREPQQNLENRDVKFCLKNKAKLNRWECNFSESLGHRDFPVTLKQKNILIELVGKILA